MIYNEFTPHYEGNNLFFLGGGTEQGNPINSEKPSVFIGDIHGEQAAKY